MNMYEHNSSDAECSLNRFLEIMHNFYFSNKIL